MTAATMKDPAKRPRPSNARRSGPRRGLAFLLLHAGLFVAAFLAFLSHEWGATAHSLVSVVIIGVITWHVASQRRWLRSAVRRRLAHPERLLVAYNAVLATVFVLVNVSGLVAWIWNLSGVVLQVHNVSGIAWILMVIGHLVLNRRRISARLRHKGPPQTALDG